MPVIPVMAAIGTAMGASATAAVAVGTVATVATVGGVAAKGYSMYQADKSAKSSAQLAKDTAGYNARVDLAEAKQIELDAEANTIAARRDAAVYTSRQKAAYASSGVLHSGSALAVEAETAGRMEQRILQERIYAGREVAKRQTAARMGIIYGDQQSHAIMVNNRASMLRGGIDLLQTVGSATMSGIGAAGPVSAGAAAGGGVRSAASFIR